MTTSTTDNLLILEVSLSTGETQVHSYPIPPYDDLVSMKPAIDMIRKTLEGVRDMLSGQVEALDYPMIAYNPAHVVRVKIDGRSVKELMDSIPAEQRPLGFATP